MSGRHDEERVSESEAQSEETIMPWIWGVIGLVVIAIFVAWTIYGASQAPVRQPAAAAPLIKQPDRGY